MPANSKIFIASKDTGYLGKDHLYLVYDTDGNSNTTSDQFVIRGGPETENGDPKEGPTDDIKIEAGLAWAASKDNEPGANPVNRNYTELTSPVGKTADSLWADLVADAKAMGKIDSEGRYVTKVPYWLPYVNNGSNSNSVIGSLLAQQEIDIYENLPKRNSTGERMPSGEFPSIGDYFVTGSGDETIRVADPRVDSVIDYGTGNTTIVIDADALAGGDSPVGSLSIRGDDNISSTDRIVLNGFDASQLSFERDTLGNLRIHLPGGSTISLVSQFSGPFAKINILDVVSPTGVTTRLLLNDASKFPYRTPKPFGDWIVESNQAYTAVHDVTNASPLVLDLDGDGVELTALAGTGAAPVYWDIDNDGFGEASAWVKSL